MSRKSMKKALWGGTFNPVHRGHIETARALQQRLQLDELALLPAARPPHRAAPEVADQHRLAMLALAVADDPRLSVDEREFRRDALSYTVDTLAEWRQQSGDDAWLAFCVGMDSLVNLTSWHCWQQITDHNHLIVCARPGWQRPLDDEQPALAAWLQPRLVSGVEQLSDSHRGRVAIIELPPWDISSSDIRQRIAQGFSVAPLVGGPVASYIERHRLYR
ncbi:Nicotinate-nucleotide adenylyltransferase [Sinobacterium norvegicum]|uniref:Probable nicotinate-nucleotide adenylyltransferase n=1 Tax=Sinobacterium norvegicum TaxID=1641715 RepID=A0ABN8EMM1_9GAMM|nr:nicotinate-nucleotide adenylyltransferase [Sinobacterium norvegicum]CAH0992430.1 Nicotinate-nucleotide adenylyltransferase [Sinobacterium norvegicum]